MVFTENGTIIQPAQVRTVYVESMGAILAVDQERVNLIARELHLDASL